MSESISQWSEMTLKSILATNTTWCCTYLSHLRMTTPLSRLLNHGRIVRPEQARQVPRLIFDGARDLHGAWVLFVDEDEARADRYSLEFVAHDLDEDPPTSLDRYHAFLIEYRKIIEDIWQLPSAKRRQLETLLGSQHYPDVVYALHGWSRILDDSLPYFTDYLMQTGVPENDVDRLSGCRISCQWALGNLSISRLSEIIGRPLKNFPRDPLLQAYGRSIALRERFKDVQEHPQGRLLLHDPVIQLIY